MDKQYVLTLTPYERKEYQEKCQKMIGLMKKMKEKASSDYEKMAWDSNMMTMNEILDVFSD